ncbi:enoyl-CoA hydratase/isomerase family protein [Actinomadura opuntiae]|uniref:enoyl-CoA hydratase/isomerase family protein n=1 Tax=Actinomadura sp. OS1-43 TaxID=604315 RepID=UPI00255AB1B0|nr:enoyl-CoA hydratase-related protein [Actinomadura sp. OS1-43]MDL4817319.1 enoyl-CoA hydratase-related protein [Actinomadura sp. OS1-43]
MNSVTIERKGMVEWVVINRPDRLNALDEPTRRALLEALNRAGDDPAVRCVVLTGTGRAFCAGQDLAARHELDDAGATVRDTYNPLVTAITGMGKPVIAAVNGLAVGAGMGLALVCDLILAAEEARFTCAFGNVGLVPDTGLSSVLVRALGHARAYELATSGRPLDAREALGLGLINAVVPAGDLATEAQARAETLADGPATAFALTKRVFHLAAHSPAAEVLAAEADAQGTAARSPEHAEGVAAFTEKRRPRFTEAH